MEHAAALPTSPAHNACKQRAIRTTVRMWVCVKHQVVVVCARRVEVEWIAVCQLLLPVLIHVPTMESVIRSLPPAPAFLPFKEMIAASGAARTSVQERECVTMRQAHAFAITLSTRLNHAQWDCVRLVAMERCQGRV